MDDIYSHIRCQGATHHGQPLEIIDMGETYLPPEVVLEYVESQRSVFT